MYGENPLLAFLNKDKLNISFVALFGEGDGMPIFIIFRDVFVIISQKFQKHIFILPILLRRERLNPHNEGYVSRRFSTTGRFMTVCTLFR